MSFLENRIPPPLVALLFMLAAWVFDATPTEQLWVQVVTAACVIAAVWVARLSMTRFILAKTTINPLRPESASSLVTDGIFSYSRNPMYLALALAVFAFSLYFTGVWALLFTGCFVAFLTQFQIKPEERALIGVFGDEYRRYRASTRRWC